MYIYIDTLYTYINTWTDRCIGRSMDGWMHGWIDSQESLSFLMVPSCCLFFHNVPLTHAHAQVSLITNMHGCIASGNQWTSYCHLQQGQFFCLGAVAALRT